MKKVLFVLLAVLLISAFVLSGCTQSKSSPAPASTTAAPASTSAAPAAAKSTTLVFSGQEMPGDALVTGFFQPWFAEIEKRTAGKVKVEDHWGEQLVKNVDSFRGIKTGVIDIAQVPVMSLPNDFPMDVIVGFTSYNTVCYGRSQVWWDLYQQFPEIQNEYKGTKVLGLFSPSDTYIGTVKKPVNTLEDMQGLKMLCTGGWDADRGKALGWTPVTVGPQDLFPALQNGLLDGNAVPPFCLRDFKVGEMLHYVSTVPVYPALFAVVMNIDKWNSLPADVQKIIDGMTLEFIKTNDNFQCKLAQDRMQSAPKEFNLQISKPSAQELTRWVQADKPVLDKFTSGLNDKGLPGTKLKDAYLQLEQKYAAPEYSPK
jgi:TRAP-type transport system periplasmic protein